MAESKFAQLSLAAVDDMSAGVWCGDVESHGTACGAGVTSITSSNLAQSNTEQQIQTNIWLLSTTLVA